MLSAGGHDKKALLHDVRCCIAVLSVFHFFSDTRAPYARIGTVFSGIMVPVHPFIRGCPHGDTMSDEKRIRCPYCQKVFKLKVKPMRDDQKTLNLQCPYCKESLAITREMIASSPS